jgi:ABC-2 type transport system ATP-binding protein
MQPVIVADNLGIQFHRNRRRRLSLREIIFQQRISSAGDTFWAVRNASFSVNQGEAVGLVGANGHGKSTLLKLVAGVLLPDEGTVTVNGGVAPMIELTAGFVPELSARDNIYLTAGFHGLSKEAIDERFDEIVDFAEVRDFLDTPFRHFSSGMKVRLGFSVMTSIEEPIVLVDEVLAVGDRNFKEKCYQRMESLLEQDRTLFLVSHSEADLLRFCKRGIYVRSGQIAFDGPIGESLSMYNADMDRKLS